MEKIKDLSPKLKTKSAEDELRVQYQAGELPFGQNLGGTQMYSNVFKRGYGNAVFGSDKNGIWLGAADFGNAPFRVDMEGKLTATSATITGMGKNFVSTLDWTATDANTASWTAGTIKTSDGISYSISAGNTGDITAKTYVYLDPAVSTTVLQTTTTATNAAGNNKILLAVVEVGATGSECVITVINSPGTTIDGDGIVTNAITASKIKAGTITADKMNVSTLSSISANIGSITSGTITGATVRTASSGARFEISGSKGASYNSSGTELTRLDGSGLTLAGTGGNVLMFKDSMAGTLYGHSGYNSSVGLYLTSSNSKDLVLNGDDEAYIFSNGNIYISPDNSIWLGGSVYCGSIDLSNGQDEGDIYSVDGIYGYNDLNLHTSGSNKVCCHANLDMKEYNIDAVDTIWAYSFSSRSDKRLKTNIAPIDGVLEKVLMLNPVSFDFKNDKGSNRFGFIAQDLYKVFPNLVTKSADGYLSVNETELIAVLVKAIQELYTMFSLSEAEKASRFVADKKRADREVSKFKDDNDIEFFEITPEKIVDSHLKSPISENISKRKDKFEAIKKIVKKA